MADNLSGPTAGQLLAYAGDLELEVDRLRRRDAFVEREVTAALARILRLCPAPGGEEGASPLAEIGALAQALLNTVADSRGLPYSQPGHDQVAAVPLRPLTEQVFRWQQRLTGAQAATLRLELDADHITWFPLRLQHILDNLIARALRCRAAAAPWVAVGLRASEGGYELRVSDNGTSPDEGQRSAESQDGTWADGQPATGLAVARMLVERSNGALTVCSREGGGTDVVLTLPGYALLDYL